MSDVCAAHRQGWVECRGQRDVRERFQEFMDAVELRGLGGDIPSSSSVHQEPEAILVETTDAASTKDS